jgi:ATP-dependent DNA helicase DinG
MIRYLTEKAILQIREEIETSGGNEVFFLGRTDEARIVTEVEPLARGNRDAVAAIMIATSFGDVVIHNHPSGRLTPSQADIEIASLLGNLGVGFYIIDNQVRNCYQAVAPFSRITLEPLSFKEVECFYAADGALSRSLKGYEFREEQTRMAFAVTEAFNGGKIALIEAGTGTGKSLAYLLPAALWAKRNKERIVVSTNTINLQEQLTTKDLPFLRESAALDIKAILVKGRGNYLCLRKLNSIQAEPSLFPDGAEDEISAIMAWSAVTRDGCRNDLAFVPKDETWEEVCCEADQCVRIKCRFYGRCFFYRARREAATADILITNHALLVTDIALRQETGYNSTAILPPFTRLIVDEGHHLEDVATSHLSSQLSRHGLLKQLSRLQNPRKAGKGLLPTLSAQLSREIPESLDELYISLSAILETKLIPERATISETVNAAMDGLALALFSKQNISGASREVKLRLTKDLRSSNFWGNTKENLSRLARELFEYSTSIGNFLKESNRLPEGIREKLAGSLTDLKGFKSRMEGESRTLLHFIADDEEECRWFEARKGAKGTLVRLCSAPLDVSHTIKSSILDRLKTVILTSATLTVGGSFAYLKNRTGIGLVESERLIELLLASPFDYQRQAFVGIPSDLPPPTSFTFERTLGPFLLRALGISRGRAFVLFTSHEAMKRMFAELDEPLQSMGLSPMCQGNTSRHQLIARFRKADKPVLFGTDSFWEGVDVKGDALQLVVIARLPFRVPTDPVIEARTEHIAATGGDPFMDYTVPEAVIKFKQGFGRLIRSRNDRGGVLILDSRVLTKNYGRKFLTSLPAARQVAGGSEEVLEALEAFFTTETATSP